MTIPPRQSPNGHVTHFPPAPPTLADPNCATCKGTGKVTSRHDGREWPCLPCQVRLDYEESRSRAWLTPTNRLSRETEVALILILGLALMALPGLLYALGWLPR
ncbi:hypothetical protein [Carbonactinospora thermoautotrophica]|uniref:hypothetical protein n=1 Tax=Carbonactinospora thermoautotrophica TaxID=1469144 RepID=UPI00082BEE56|nr:hypothetical protein [Carbonactinospora thermoautotrophica]